MSSEEQLAARIGMRRGVQLAAAQPDLEHLNERYSLEERLDKFREVADEAMVEIEGHNGRDAVPLVGYVIDELADVLVVLDSLLLRPDIGPQLLERLEATYKRLRERVDAGEFGPASESQASTPPATHYEMKKRGSDGTRRFQSCEAIHRVAGVCQHERSLTAPCPWCRDLHDAYTRATGEP